MIFTEIVKKNGEKLFGYEDTDIEFVDPIVHHQNNFVFQQLMLNGVPYDEIIGNKPITGKSKAIFIEAEKKWSILFAKWKKMEITNSLLKITEIYKKNDQTKFLKGITLTPEILIAFTIQIAALGFTFSKYKSHYPQKGIDILKLPHAYFIDSEGNPKIFGETNLTKGQLKQALEHRKVKIAMFFDNGNRWHCFITTFKSLRGEEKWINKYQPHYHYLSDSFGVSRRDVVKQIKSERYSLGNLPHIALKEYGMQPD